MLRPFTNDDAGFQFEIQLLEMVLAYNGSPRVPDGVVIREIEDRIPIELRIMGTFRFPSGRCYMLAERIRHDMKWDGGTGAIRAFSPTASG